MGGWVAQEARARERMSRGTWCEKTQRRAGHIEKEFMQRNLTAFVEPAGPLNCDRLKRAGAVETTRCFAPAALAVAVSHSLIPTAIRFSTRTVVSLSAGPSS